MSLEVKSHLFFSLALGELWPCPTESADLSDSFESGDEDNSKNLKEINSNWLTSSTCTTSSSLQEARLRAKAKRRLRKTSSRDSGRGDSLSDAGDGLRGTPAPPSSPKSKLLDRKSRHGKGRGLPKKGGHTVPIWHHKGYMPLKGRVKH